ncbi:hypothetical protein SAMN03097708_02290 [Thiohalomonas denitrificans]|uniref:Uncharacterized protein n=1 Tax=Thiohalomonas denitrificans TaxID=415747 RepID=A0A1G5QKY8_9GAMM|nr:hypothetical protein SAMN03097708_02290 [Thiohalomonas denitrificans]
MCGNFIRLLVCGLFAVALAACGGGGGGDSDENSSVESSSDWDRMVWDQDHWN